MVSINFIFSKRVEEDIQKAKVKIALQKEREEKRRQEAERRREQYLELVRKSYKGKPKIKKERYVVY